MQDYIIQPQEGKKGRSFKATCIALVTATGILPDLSGGNNIRPVWAMFAGSESELRPFMANLKLGRKADQMSNFRSRADARIEFMKSMGYHMAWQREAEGSLVTIYQPDIFRLDPGMVDPDGIRFLMLVPADWAENQTVDRDGPANFVKGFGHSLDLETLKRLVPVAYLFAAYLDRRTRCPLIADGRFYLQILCAALSQKMASHYGDDVKNGYYSRETWGYNHKHGFNAFGLDDAGFLTGFSFTAKHEEFEAFLAHQVSLYFDLADDFVPLDQRVDLTSFMEAE